MRLATAAFLLAIAGAAQAAPASPYLGRDNPTGAPMPAQPGGPMTGDEKARALGRSLSHLAVPIVAGLAVAGWWISQRRRR